VKRLRHKLLAVAAPAALVALACGDHSTPVDPGDGPAVTITSHAAGDTVSAVGFTLSGSAADPDGVESVRLKVDGDVLATAGASVFSFFVPSLLFESGADRAITVEGEDGVGDKGSKTITVYVREMSIRSIGSGADKEREPAWSPTGAEIAYSSEGTVGNEDVYVVSAEGGAPVQVTTSVNDDRSPSWAPAGDRIAFTSNRGGNWDIWTIPAAGGEATQVTVNLFPDRAPAWSPSGASIAFHSKRDGNWNIYAVSVVSGSPSGNPVAATAAASAESSAAWSTGGEIAFVTNQLGGSDIYTVNPPDPVLSPVAGANDFTVRELDPAYCPQGPYLLFSDNRNGQYDIWVLHPATGRKRVVASHVAADWEPAWSPQGDRIAFSSNRGGTYDIWIVE